MNAAEGTSLPSGMQLVLRHQVVLGRVQLALQRAHQLRGALCLLPGFGLLCTGLCVRLHKVWCLYNFI